MSLPRPSGLRPPTSRIGKPSSVPGPKTGIAAPQSTPGPPKPTIASSRKSCGLAKPTGRPSLGLAPPRGLIPPSTPLAGHQPSCALRGGPDPSEDGSVNVDDFIIGDRVWVSGTKPGVIAFIGVTQFAPGEWAGIVLDEPVGKNDGSVMGHRYFQCEPKRGVFSRLTKLFHSPQSPSRPASQGYDSSSSDAPKTSSRLQTPSTANGTPSTGIPPARPSSRLGMSSTKHLSTSSSSINKEPLAPPASRSATLRLPGAQSQTSAAKLGDRVFVSGSKTGILRYIGEADFAKGIWAGVELDDPLGKNDGAVAGKRYFECKPLHGLFAPVHKISRAGGSVSSTPSPHARPLMSTSLRSSRERSGSQESVSSISSTASSVSRSRATKTPGQRPSTLNLSASQTAALQKALKEKEEHIEQLLRERDLERSEVARAAAHVDEAEGQLSNMKSEKERMSEAAESQISTLQTQLSDLESEKQELQAFLEEEKRKVEDLQFQLEEAALEADDGDSKVSELQVKELERQAKKEKERADKLEAELKDLKHQLETHQKSVSEAETAQVSYLDQIEELTHKLTQAESQVRAFESARLEDGAKTSQVSIELVEKAERVKELEEVVDTQKQQMSHMAQQLQDVKDELVTNKERSKRHEANVDELTNKLRQIQEEHKKLLEELRNSNSQAADLQLQLTASQNRTEELVSDKAKVESQMSELMKNSGDSSSQLASLNEQLMEKNRKVEDLQNDLLNSSQSLAKSVESHRELEQQAQHQLEETTRSHQATQDKLKEEINDLSVALEKSKTKLAQVSETLEGEKREIQERKESQIKELQQQLAENTSELTTQRDQTQAHKQLLEKVTLEKDELQYAKSQAEKLSKRVEGEKAATNTELIQTKVEMTRLREELTTLQGRQSQGEDTVERLTLELEFANKEKLELSSARDEARGQNQKLVADMETVQQEAVQLREESLKKDVQLEEVRKELSQRKAESEKKAEELMQKSQTDAEQMTQEMSSLKSSISQLKCELQEKEDEMFNLQEELMEKEKIVQDKEMLAKEKVELLKEQESSQERYRELIKEVEKQSQKFDTLQSELKVVQTSEGALRREKSNLEESLTQLKSELNQSRSELSQSRSELSKARSEVTQAQEAAAQSAENMAGDAMYAQLKEEADSAHGQVDFLNSVIVELQNKNSELHQRLSAMEDSGIHTNGDFVEPHEEASRASRVPPRLFCDICDCFDLHDTEDCPTQAMEDTPEPSHHGGDRRSQRPYCEICESFGHWTDDCEDEETF